MQGFFQRSFVSGIVDPSLVTRRDADRLNFGLKDCRNWQVLRQGGVANRPGLQYLGASKASSSEPRMVRWSFNDEQSYALEVGQRYIRIWQDGALLTIDPGDTDTAPAWAADQSYVPGDIVVVSTRLYYCVARHDSHSTNEPTTPAGGNYFWFQLAELTASADILEIPTPYLQADLAGLNFTQSGDVMTITSRVHPPHDLTRTGATAWTCLPTRFIPRQAQPTALSSGGTGSSGSNPPQFRYKVTAVRADTFEESLPGMGAKVGSGAVITKESAESTGDLVVEHTSHGIPSTGVTDVWVDTSVYWDSNPTYANESLYSGLSGSIFRVEYVNADSFKLEGSAGLITWPVLDTTHAADSIGGGGDISVDWGYPYIEPAGKKLPKNVATKIVLTWTAPAGGAVDSYNIYRSKNDGPYGLLVKSEQPTYTDQGDADDDS